MPVEVLWSLRDDLEELYGKPLDIWRLWAPGVVGHGIDSGHHMAEEAPDELAATLSTFFDSVHSKGACDARVNHSVIVAEWQSTD